MRIGYWLFDSSSGRYHGTYSWRVVVYHGTSAVCSCHFCSDAVCVP